MHGNTKIKFSHDVRQYLIQSTMYPEYQPALHSVCSSLSQWWSEEPGETSD